LPSIARFIRRKFIVVAGFVILALNKVGEMHEAVGLEAAGLGDILVVN